METMPHSQQQEMLDYHQAAELVGVPVGTLYSWVAVRAIPHYRLGPRLVRFRRAELVSWLASRKVAATISTNTDAATGTLAGASTTKPA